MVKVGEGKREGYYCCSSGNSSCSFNGIGAIMSLGVRITRSSPGPTTSLAYDRRQTLTLPRLIFFFCKGLGLGDPSNLNGL